MADAAGGDEPAGLEGWFTKAGEKAMSQAKRRYFKFNEGKAEMEYYVKPGEKKAKGSIELHKASKIVCEESKLFIHCPGRVWELGAEHVGQVQEWGKVFLKVCKCDIMGLAVNPEDMLALANEVKAGTSEKKKLPAGHRRIELMREGKGANFGVQFQPHEGRGDGVEICGIQEGGPADGILKVGEKVCMINDERLDGLTYQEAVHLVAAVVQSTVSVLKLEVSEKPRYGLCAADYDAQEDTELSMKVGDRVRVVGEEADGWQKGMIGDMVGWFPATYIDMEAEIEIERYVPETVVNVNRLNDAPERPPPPQAREPTPPPPEPELLTAWPTPFPDVKVWNHGRIDRQRLQDTADLFSKTHPEDTLFLLRMKDKHCFSMCVKGPEGEPFFVLFEKNLETGVWAADSVPCAKMDPENEGESIPCKTLGPAVESTLLLKALHNAIPVPKP